MSSKTDFREAFNRVYIRSDTHEMFFCENGELSRQYYRSHHWRELKRRKLAQADYRCEMCGEEFHWGYDFPTVHHKTYERLGEERLSDLTAMCSFCHELEHKTDPADPLLDFLLP